MTVPEELGKKLFELDDLLAQASLTKSQRVEVNNLLRAMIIPAKAKPVRHKVKCEMPICTNLIRHDKKIRRCFNHHPTVCRDCGKRSTYAEDRSSVYIGYTRRKGLEGLLLVLCRDCWDKVMAKKGTMK